MDLSRDLRDLVSDDGALAVREDERPGLGGSSVAKTPTVVDPPENPPVFLPVVISHPASGTRPRRDRARSAKVAGPSR
jgi:hypothetical protein